MDLLHHEFLAPFLSMGVGSDNLETIDAAIARARASAAAATTNRSVVSFLTQCPETAHFELLSALVANEDVKQRVENYLRADRDVSDRLETWNIRAWHTFAWSSSIVCRGIHSRAERNAIINKREHLHVELDRIHEAERRVACLKLRAHQAIANGVASWCVEHAVDDRTTLSKNQIVARVSMDPSAPMLEIGVVDPERHMRRCAIEVLGVSRHGSVCEARVHVKDAVGARRNIAVCSLPDDHGLQNIKLDNTFVVCAGVPYAWVRSRQGIVRVVCGGLPVESWDVEECKENHGSARGASVEGDGHRHAGGT